MAFVLSFLLRRLAQGVIIVLVVMMIVFTLLRIIPGDPAQLITGGMASQEHVKKVAEELGLTDPIPVQFARYLKGILQGDFGASFIRTASGSASAASILRDEVKGRARVVDLILERIPLTLQLASTALLFSVIVSVIIGLWAGLNHGRWPDKLALYISSAFISLPNFWLALILAMIFALWLNLLPAIGYNGFSYTILPAIVLSAEMVPFLIRGLSVSMAQALREPYVAAGYVRGLKRHRIIFCHALKNASVPLLNLFGIQLGGLLGGVLIVEFIFNYPGLGHLAIHAVFQRDFPLVQAIVILTSSIFVVVNIFVDLMASFIDPRLEY